jgi:hypothetical protein
MRVRQYPVCDPLGQLTMIVDIPVDSLLEMIEFFTALILNADEKTHL